MSTFLVICGRWKYLTRDVDVAVDVVCVLTVQLLAGANINDVTPQKTTALHLAATHDRASICAALLGEHIHCDALDDALNNGNDC